MDHMKYYPVTDGSLVCLTCRQYLNRKIIEAWWRSAPGVCLSACLGWVVSTSRLTKPTSSHKNQGLQTIFSVPWRWWPLFALFRSFLPQWPSFAPSRDRCARGRHGASAAHDKRHNQQTAARWTGYPGATATKILFHPPSNSLWDGNVGSRLSRPPSVRMFRAAEIKFIPNPSPPLPPGEWKEIISVIDTPWVNPAWGLPGKVKYVSKLLLSSEVFTLWLWCKD